MERISEDDGVINGVFNSKVSPASTGLLKTIEGQDSSDNTSIDRKKTSDQTSEAGEAAMVLKVGDCAIFCSSGNNIPDKTSEDSQLPFIGRIESFWREVKIRPPVCGDLSTDSTGDYNLRKSGERRVRSPVKTTDLKTNSPTKQDQEYDNYTVDDEEKMRVKVRWFYHPPEAVPKNKKLNPLKILKEPEGGLFESLTHSDENDVQTISCTCLVLGYDKFKKRKTKNKVYYLAGKYEPLMKEITYEAGVPLLQS